MPVSPSLALSYNFAQDKSLVSALERGPDLTLTRASDGTYYNSAGILQIAGTNVARFDHNPDTLVSLGLLLEPASTNIMLRSQEFDDATWGSDGFSATNADATTSPDGTSNADEVVENSSSSQHRKRQTLSYTSGTQYVLSCFVKRAFGTRNVQLDFAGASAFPASCNGQFDLSDGTVQFTGAGTDDVGVEALGNNWYRCFVVATATSTTTGNKCQQRVTKLLLYQLS